MQRIMKRLWLVFLFFFSIVMVSSAQEMITSESCSECHGKNNKESAVVTTNMVDTSVHEGTDCLECHEGITELPHSENLEMVVCANCHEDEAVNYKLHGSHETGTNADIPACADCHGTHDVLASSDTKSRIHPLNLPSTCGTCHEDPEIARAYALLTKNPIRNYQSSVHASATAEGNKNAATCRDCHFNNGSAHQILTPGNTNSPVNHFAIPGTCGKCHSRIEKEYWNSIHGKLTARGKTNSPVCTSCHGEHRILSHTEKRSSVNSSQLAEATCSPCHESANLIEQYGLPAGRPVSFIDSYHGLKSNAGDTTVANCIDCHSTHSILPATDTKSTIHFNNRQGTCGKCHLGINADLAQTIIHSNGKTGNSGWPMVFTNVYFIIISATVAGMLLFIIFDFWRQTRNMMLKKQVKRMSRSAVFQHMLLAISFFLLAVTGFALRHADSWWALLLFGREGGFFLRNTIHRISAVLFILITLTHLIYLPSTRGRVFIKMIFPGLHDLRQLIQMIKYNLGFSKNQPIFDRFSFVEKFEYWALAWGGAIMIITGIFLWYDNFFIRFLPKTFLDVMVVIHYYEAWLATLAILILHLYATVFSPNVYPMNPSWLTGKMPQEQHDQKQAKIQIERKNITSEENR